MLEGFVEEGREGSGVVPREGRVWAVCSWKEWIERWWVVETGGLSCGPFEEALVRIVKHGSSGGHEFGGVDGGVSRAPRSFLALLRLETEYGVG